MFTFHICILYLHVFKCHDHTHHHLHISWNYLFTYNIRCVQLLYVFKSLVWLRQMCFVTKCYDAMYHQFLLVHVISYRIHREDMIIYTWAQLLACCVYYCLQILYTFNTLICFGFAYIFASCSDNLSQAIGICWPDVRLHSSHS